MYKAHSKYSDAFSCWMNTLLNFDKTTFVNIITTQYIIVETFRASF